MRTHAHALTTLCLAAAAAIGAVSVAEARRDGYGAGYGYVTAESRYGGQTITAPVRTGPAGRLEVRLPGGTWIECGRSCRDTLRRETIDFWASRDRGGGAGDGPGYLRFRF